MALCVDDMTYVRKILHSSVQPECVAIKLHLSHYDTLEHSQLNIKDELAIPVFEGYSRRTMNII